MGNHKKKTSKPAAKTVAAKSASAKPASKGAKPASKGAKAAKPVAASSKKVAAKVASFVKEKLLGKKGAEVAPAGKLAKGQKAAKEAPVVAAPVGKLAKGKGKKLSGIPASLLGAASSPSAESVCREVACEGLSTTGGYCRMHYIKNWKKIKRKEVILREKKLNQYIEELIVKYPDKYIEAIRQDLESDKDFAKVIYDLDLDESVDDFEVEGEGDDNLLDHIKRDIDGEGEGF